jgi:hypothetical protein
VFWSRVTSAAPPDAGNTPAGGAVADPLAQRALCHILSADTSRADVRELRENASRSVRELARAGMLPPTVTEELIALLASIHRTRSA